MLASTSNSNNFTPFSMSSLKIFFVGKFSLIFPSLNVSAAVFSALKDLGFNEEGYEPSKWMVNYGKEKYKININQGFIDIIDNNKKFDLIYKRINDPDAKNDYMDKLSKNRNFNWRKLWPDFLK